MALPVLHVVHVTRVDVGFWTNVEEYKALKTVEQRKQKAEMIFSKRGVLRLIY